MPCEILVKATDKPGGVWFKGDPVVVKDDPVFWGAKEGPPNWVIVRVTDSSAAQIEQYMAAWKREFEFDILANTQAGWRIRISVDPKVRQVFGIDKAFRNDFRDYLIDTYGAVVHDYDNVNHEYAELDFPKPLLKLDISPAAEVTLSFLQQDFLDKAEDALQPRLYYFSSADVDAALTAGGKVNQTLAQIQAKVINRLTE